MRFPRDDDEDDDDDGGEEEEEEEEEEAAHSWGSGFVGNRGSWERRMISVHMPGRRR